MIQIKEHNRFGPADEAALAAFEKRHAIRLPQDYRDFLLACNGGDPRPIDTVDFTCDGAHTSVGIVHFDGLHDGPAWASLEWNMETFAGRIVPEAISIGADAGGNQIVLMVSGERRGQVYFWDHELEDDPPGFDNMSLLSGSFTELAGKLYEYADPAESEVERIFRTKDLEGLQALLDSGYDIETKDAYDRTLIENAAIKGEIRLIALLAERGAKLRESLRYAENNWNYFPEHGPAVELLRSLEASAGT